MLNEAEFIVALESRKRLVKIDCVCNSGKYAYAIIWTELMAVLREMAGGDAIDEQAEAQAEV